MSYARTIIAVGTNQTIPVRNEVYLVDGSTGPTGNTGTVYTMPDIVSDGMSYTFRRYDSGASGTVVTIKGFTGTQTINGLTAITLPAQSDTVIQSYNGIWYTVKNVGKGAGSGLPLTFNFTQPNGDALESKSNTWFRMGTFAYQGTSVDPTINVGWAVMYTTNAASYYRVRIYNATNAQVCATSGAFNAGTLTTPQIISFGTFSNLPSGLSLMEIQVLSTDATGNTGLTGRQNIGLFDTQLYG